MNKELLKQALEALLSVKNHGWNEDTHTGRALITDLKAALEQQQVGPVEDMLLRRAVLRSAKIVSDGRFVTKQAALEQPPLPVQEPVAWVTVEGGVWVSTRSADFRHIADGQYQLYAGPLQNDVFAAISTLKAIGYVYDNGKFCKEGEQWIAPTASQPPLPEQEPVEMRMPKVGDRIVCLEDESLGKVVSLTAGGSPDILFDDGSHGTYLPREFFELFGYAEQRQPLTDEQIKVIHFDLCNTVGSDYKTVARAIEAAHGIKEQS